MPFKVTDIIESIKSKGVLKTSKFDVKIGRVSNPNLNENLTLRCIAASIPGISLITSDFKLYGGMPTLKVPTGRNYNDIRLTFLTQSDSSDRYYFQTWFNNISNFGTNTVGYYDNLAKNIDIKVYDEYSAAVGNLGSQITLGFEGGTSQSFPTGIVPGTYEKNIGYKVTVLNAIPNNLDEVDLSWADSDKLLEYSVTFSYEQLLIQGLPGGTPIPTMS